MGWRITVLTLVLVTGGLASPDYKDYYDENADRSYKFSFDYEDFSREEEADAQGNVVGQYTYKDQDGIQRSLSYRAGANIGFVPEAGNLLDFQTMQSFDTFGQKMPEKVEKEPKRLVKSMIPMQTGYPKPKENPVKFYAPTTPSTLYNAPFAPKPSPAPALALPTSLYQAPKAPEVPSTLYNAPAPILPTPTTLYNAPMAPAVQQTYEVPDISIQTYEAPIAPALPVTPAPMMQMDASYNFKFEESDHSRQEEADANGNIKGKYSYKNSEGNDIVVQYSAGPNQGFVIENQEELAQSVSKATLDAAEVQKSRNIDEVEKTNGIYFEQPKINQETWIQSRSYKYGFSDNDLSRSEVSDEDGNVQGTYTIPDVNGKPILVKYHAGPSTGFVIENMAEVQARTNPELINAPQPSTTIEPSKPLEPSEPIQTIRSKNGRRLKVVKKARKPFVDPLAEDRDASYKFAYGSAEASESRQEESDSKGNIRGQYRYTNQDGNPILVRYSAGANRGFVIENSKELNENVAKATNDFAIKRKMKIVTRRRKNRNNGSKRGRSFFRDPISSQRNQLPKKSFSFKAKNAAGSFEESADSNGERFGSYNFVNGQGKSVVVRYRAGRNGFQILNPDDVLPKPPQAYV